MRPRSMRIALLALLVLAGLVAGGCGSSGGDTTATKTTSDRLSATQFAAMEAKAVAVGQALQAVSRGIQGCTGSSTEIRKCAAGQIAGAATRLDAFVGEMQPYVAATTGACRADLVAFNASVKTMAGHFKRAAAAFTDQDKTTAVTELKAVNGQIVTAAGNRAEASCKPDASS